MSVEDYVEKYGDGGRFDRLIRDALKWLDENEGNWGLDHELDREKYLHGLITNAARMDGGVCPVCRAPWSEHKFREEES